MPIFNNPHNETIYLLTKENKQIKAENKNITKYKNFNELKNMIDNYIVELGIKKKA